MLIYSVTTYKKGSVYIFITVSSVSLNSIVSHFVTIAVDVIIAKFVNNIR